MLEGIGGHVVADRHDASLRNGGAGHALPQPKVRQLDALALGLADAGVERPMQRLALGVELVDDGAVPAQQPDGFVGDAL